jgi:multiple sugar transport system permease protein
MSRGTSIQSGGTRRFRRVNWRNQLKGFLFASPFIVGFLALQLYPFLASLYYSFTDFSLMARPHWLGLENYRHMLFGDPVFRTALANTIYLVLLGIPIYVFWSLITALLLNLRVAGRSLFRTIYFLPAITPTVAATFVWIWLLKPRTGIVSFYLSKLGIVAPLWFNDPHWAKPGVILLWLWAVGVDTVILLTALQGVPKELHEAAELEGAGWWARTVYVDLPIISPALLFVTVNCVIWVLQTFTQPFLITGGQAATGGRESSLLFFSMYIWANAFQYVKMGYASALAWMLFILNLGLALVVLRATNRRVFYS